MRTVLFRDVYYSILRRLGLDPLKDDNYDRAYSIVSHINRRIKYVWRAANWPELRTLEVRPFRTPWQNWLTWTAGEELFYDADGLYYQCILNAPANTDPPNITYFSPIEITDFYIAFDQRGQTPMDEVLLIYPSDPTLQKVTGLRNFRISSQGVNVQTSSNQVWVLYKMIPSQFSLVPQVSGKTYNIGDIYYNPGEGNCYRVLQSTSDGTTITELVPFPDIFESYIVPMVFGDACLELSPSGMGDYQVRMAAAQVAYAEAQDYITSELDRIGRQGYSNYYPPWHLRTGARQGHVVQQSETSGDIILGYTIGGDQLLFR